MEEDSLEGLKYVRWGPVDLGRNCDSILNRAFELLPGDGVMPARWHYRSLERFQRVYGHMGDVVWSKATSHSLLLVRGHKVFRIWTDVASDCLVDVHNSLASKLSDTFEIIQIPPSTERKTKPFSQRIRLQSESDADILVLQTKLLFDLI